MLIYREEKAVIMFPMGMCDHSTSRLSTLIWTVTWASLLARVLPGTTPASIERFCPRYELMAAAHYKLVVQSPMPRRLPQGVVHAIEVHSACQDDGTLPFCFNGFLLPVGETSKPQLAASHAGTKVPRHTRLGTI